MTAFQFTTSQGGRHRHWPDQQGGISFNSRPHKEVDKWQKSRRNSSILSIHDLTRRSTQQINDTKEQLDLSIHDLTRRSTSKSFLFAHCSFPFNSRPHKEVDGQVYTIWTATEHFQFTTSQGGRPCTRSYDVLQDSFNSRPHKEVDLSPWWNVCSDRLSIHDLTRRSTTFCRSLCRRSVFQFTTSQGGRHWWRETEISTRDFQFTTSQGGRQ